jgi:peptidoglycan/xylan/chitin deacetylase (PgdA/CDA1 family)
MYHHVNSDRCSNEYAIFESHLAYISENFTSVFPTLDKLPKKAICLVFDDGYYDFYKLIFPLLQKYKLKALLGVVPSVTLESTDKSDDVRLAPEHNHLFAEYKNGTFCTYEELKEMQSSGLVQIASHSLSHVNLLEENVALTQELKTSQEILEEKLGKAVESFIFPFGKYNQKVLKETQKYYKYAFRIGNGVNKDFSGVNGVIYRIDADNLTDASSIFSFKNMLKFRIKTLTKALVGNR